MLHRLPTASDLAILSGAIWESPRVRAARGIALVIVAIGVDLALIAAAEIKEDRLRAQG